MAVTYGRQLLTPVVGTSIQCLANLSNVEWHPVGVTVDWSTVPALTGADVLLNEGITIKVGAKALPCGQVLLRITSGGNAGMYGPYDVNATDGRQTLARGRVGIVNELVVEAGVLAGLLTGTTAHVAIFHAGLVWKKRLLTSLNANPIGDFATGPTLALLEPVTDLQYIED